MRFSLQGSARGHVRRLASLVKQHVTVSQTHRYSRTSLSARVRRYALIVSMLLTGSAVNSAWGEDTAVAEAIEAITPGAPTAVETQYADDREAAAKAYVECLKAQKDQWVVTPDYAQCDTARAAYAQFVPADAAPMVLGCVEESVIGAPRITGQGCDVFHKRFVSAPDVASTEEAAQ